jgi:hypothetical protein
LEVVVVVVVERLHRLCSTFLRRQAFAAAPEAA